MIGAAVNVALVPVAVAKDAVNVVTGNAPEATEELVEKAVTDACEALEDLADGDL